MDLINGQQISAKKTGSYKRTADFQLGHFPPLFPIRRNSQLSSFFFQIRFFRTNPFSVHSIVREVQFLFLRSL